MQVEAVLVHHHMCTCVAATEPTYRCYKVYVYTSISLQSRGLAYRYDPQRRTLTAVAIAQPTYFSGSGGCKRGTGPIFLSLQVFQGQPYGILYDNVQVYTADICCIPDMLIKFLGVPLGALY